VRHFPSALLPTRDLGADGVDLCDVTRLHPVVDEARVATSLRSDASRIVDAARLLIQDGADEYSIAPQFEPMRAKAMIGPSYRGTQTLPMTELEP
jgi:hypothetical protein